MPRLAESSPTPGLHPSAVAPALVRIRPSLRNFRLMHTVLAVVAFGLVLLYQWEVAGVGGVGASTQMGRLYGLVGTGLMLFLAFYPLRRVLYRGRIGTMEFWYRAHLAVGVLGLALIGCHCGFAFRSPFLATLQIGFWGTVLTGVAGWVYQDAMKKWMMRHEPRPTVLRELVQRRETLLKRLEAFRPPVPEPEVKDPGLATDDDDDEPPAPRVADPEAVRRLLTDRRKAALLELRFREWAHWDALVEEICDHAGGLPPAARQLLRELTRVEVLSFYHRILRGWTTIHLLFTLLTLQLVCWHIFIVATSPR